MGRNSGMVYDGSDLNGDKMIKNWLRKLRSKAYQQGYKDGSSIKEGDLIRAKKEGFRAAREQQGCNGSRDDFFHIDKYANENEYIKEIMGIK